MASLFFDSSAIVKRYVRETGSGWVRRITAVAAATDLYLVRITGVEVVAALVRHSPPITPPVLTRALANFQRHFQTRFQLVPVNQSLVARAMAFAESYHLRGYDAVQLAAAVQVHTAHGGKGAPLVTLVSADLDLNTAAAAEGLTVDNPNHHL